MQRWVEKSFVGVINFLGMGDAAALEYFFSLLENAFFQALISDHILILFIFLLEDAFPEGGHRIFFVFYWSKFYTVFLLVLDLF